MPVSATADSSGDLVVTKAGDLKGKVVFRPTQNTSTAKTPMITTAKMNSQGYISVGNALKNHGILSSESNEILGQSFLHGVSGITSVKGMGQAASPMTPSLALLQNVAGSHAALRPPNLGKTIELMMVLGATGSLAESASQSWARAARLRVKQDPLLRTIDGAFAEALLPGYPEPRNHKLSVEEISTWQGRFGSSPFSWFAKMWPAITSEPWVKALPARVWTDWATTILRFAFGASYLWEAAWYESIARTVVGDSVPSWGRVLEDMPAPLQWRSSSAAVSVRDLAPVLMWRVHRATYILRILDDWVSKGRADWEADRALAAMRKDPALVAALVKCLSSKRRTSTGNNTWEAIKYALKVRESLGAQADHYGLLDQRNRFLTAEPRTEWVAVMASLSCHGPGGESDVARVLNDLDELGMRPELMDLISLLERAGLARGSADADQGVRVKSAF